MRLHYLQHVWFEDLGIIKAWADEHDFEVTRTAFFDNEPLPAVADIDWLVVMGGPMNIYEQEKFSWLTEEKKFIREAIDNGKVVLGICLGAQLIADALGAHVTRNTHKEIGWYPIRFTGDKKFPGCLGCAEKCLAFHWHSDRFDIPAGATRIAESDACANQAFSYDNDRIIGVQFHFELTKQGVQRMLTECKNELTDEQFVQHPQDILGYADALQNSNKCMYRILNTMYQNKNQEEVR